MISFHLEEVFVETLASCVKMTRKGWLKLRLALSDAEDSTAGCIDALADVETEPTESLLWKGLMM